MNQKEYEAAKREAEIRRMNAESKVIERKSALPYWRPFLWAIHLLLVGLVGIFLAYIK